MLNKFSGSDKTWIRNRYELELATRIENIFAIFPVVLRNFYAINSQ